MGSHGGDPWDPMGGTHGIPGWALGDPLALGDPWALGDPGPWGPWALGTLGLGDPWALGAGALRFSQSGPR